jgi:hypothetical protein
MATEIISSSRDGFIRGSELQWALASRMLREAEGFPTVARLPYHSTIQRAVRCARWFLGVTQRMQLRGAKISVSRG